MPEKTNNELFKEIFEEVKLYQTTYNVLKGFGINYNSTGYEKSLIRSEGEILNPCTGFNYTLKQLLNMYYYLGKEAHFSISDLDKCDWFFAYNLYEMFAEEIEKKNKQQKEENERQEQEMANYQQMQEYQSRMMGNMSQSMPSMPTF